MELDDIEALNSVELTPELIAWECRRMDKEDVYQWIYSDEKEIERLNNIIEELEKWLKQEADFWKQQQEKAIKNGWLEFGGKYNTTIIYENAINKLKELKEGDKNDNL